MLSLSSKLLVQLSLIEDIAGGDVTTEACIPEDSKATAVIIARESFVLCGHLAAAEVFEELERRYGLQAEYRPEKEDGTHVKEGDVLAHLSGSLRAILCGERTALNFLQRLSGITSGTAKVCESFDLGKVEILDTRKTTPGWRELEKYAVRVGGGHNHRFGLYDQVLIKNNHVDALDGDIAEAVRKSKAHAPKGMRIEVEVRDLEELSAALSAQPDAILLDNMSPELLREAVTTIRGAANGAAIRIEASGGITEKTLPEVLNSGVDAVSMGALTHSAKAVDISLRFEKSA